MLCLLLIAYCPLLSAQKDLPFSFEHEGKTWQGSVAVELLYKNAPVKSVLNDPDQPLLLVISNPVFPDEFSLSKPKVAVSVSIEGTALSLDVGGKIEVAPGKIKNASLLATSSGTASVSLSAPVVRLLGTGGDIPAEFDSHYSISVSIEKSGGQKDGEDEKEPDDQEARDWNDKRLLGPHGLDKYLTIYGSEGRYGNEAKEKLEFAIRQGRDDAKGAAEAYLRHFPDGSHAERAKAVLEGRPKEQAQDEKQAEQDPAEAKYREIQAIAEPERRIEELKKFIDAYPKTTWAKDALRQVPLVPYMEARAAGSPENVSVYKLKYAVSPTLLPGWDTLGLAVEIGADYRLKITRLQEGDFRLRLSDAGKEPAVADFEMQIGNPLLVELPAATGDTVYSLSLRKGVPPFQLNFSLGSQWRSALRIARTDTVLHFSLSQLRQLLGGEGGEYLVSIAEVQRNLEYEAGGFLLPAKKFPWLIVGAAVALLAGLFIFSKMKKAARKKELEAKYKKIEEEKAAARSDAQADMLVMTPSLAPAPTPPSEALASSTPSTHQPIKIRSIKKAEGHSGLSREEFEALLASGDYFKVEMGRFWRDTALRELHLHKKSIADLDRFLRSQNVHEIQEQEGTVPEIGGFLLGKYHMGEDGTCLVTAEEFVPVSPKMHNVYQLEFSTSAIAQELGDAQEQFPDLTLVSWFHTHPGHGLFLSGPDLKIHEGFFKERHQFAMEIDSLSERLDTGFFTRTKDGKANNRPGLRPEAKWLAWAELLK